MGLWKDVAGYEGFYLVSNEGQILSLPRIVSNGRGIYFRKGRVLKPSLKGKDGLLYEYVVLCNGKKTKSKAIHRLVAEAFVENPNGYEVINHIDHNTLNNHANNLEWCTQQYNNEYGHNTPVEQYTLDGEKIAEYKSLTIAEAMTGIKRNSISNVLRGISKTSGGYIWKYANGGNER